MQLQCYCILVVQHFSTFYKCCKILHCSNFERRRTINPRRRRRRFHPAARRRYSDDSSSSARRRSCTPPRESQSPRNTRTIPDGRFPNSLSPTPTHPPPTTKKLCHCLLAVYTDAICGFRRFFSRIQPFGYESPSNILSNNQGRGKKRGKQKEKPFELLSNVVRTKLNARRTSVPSFVRMRTLVSSASTPAYASLLRRNAAAWCATRKTENWPAKWDVVGIQKNGVVAVIIFEANTTWSKLNYPRIK